jgi:hypothetical protein
VSVPAPAAGVAIEVFTASTNGEIDAAFACMVQKWADTLLIGTNMFSTTARGQSWPRAIWLISA